MNLIVLRGGNKLAPTDEERKAQECYKNDSRFRKVADQIHHSRLMCGKACIDCMVMAFHKLKLNKT